MTVHSTRISPCKHEITRIRDGKAVYKNRCVTLDIIPVIHKALSKNRPNDKLTEKGCEDVPKHDPTSIHGSIGLPIAIAQCFALFPLCGVLGTSASSLRFKWISFRVFFSLVIFLGVTTMAILHVIRLSKIGLNFYKTDLVFCISGALTIVQFIIIARKWPALISEWSRIECNMGPPSGPTLAKTINIMSALILSVSLVEHLMSISSGIVYSRECSSKQDPFEAYFDEAFPHVFCHTKYAHWKGVLVEFIHIMSTFAWNFMDLFIILVSIALAQRFKQINNKLNGARGKLMPDMFWRLAREEYVRLTDLLCSVDDVIGPLVIFSLTNNLYFICAQLLNSVKSFHEPVQATYFWFSFAFLLIRTVAMCLYAARVHEESQGPLYALRAVPSLGYSEEVQRFTKHVSSELIGLTGMKFFTITRGVVLTVASTIVTYELVLMQFTGKNEPMRMSCQWKT